MVLSSLLHTPVVVKFLNFPDLQERCLCCSLPAPGGREWQQGEPRTRRSGCPPSVLRDSGTPHPTPAELLQAQGAPLPALLSPGTPAQASPGAWSCQKLGKDLLGTPQSQDQAQPSPPRPFPEGLSLSPAELPPCSEGHGVRKRRIRNVQGCPVWG